MRLFNKFRVVFKNFIKRYRLVNQFCKKCGKSDKYDFSVSDETWKKLPMQYQDKELCFTCFMEEVQDSEFLVHIYKI